MNDLAFGATLLASFVSLLVGVIIEGSSAADPALHAAAKADTTSLQAVRLAKAPAVDCAKLAQAPAAAR